MTTTRNKPSQAEILGNAQESEGEGDDTFDQLELEEASNSEEEEEEEEEGDDLSQS